jgi:hypothetical protein
MSLIPLRDLKLPDCRLPDIKLPNGRLMPKEWPSRALKTAVRKLMNDPLASHRIRLEAMKLLALMEGFLIEVERVSPPAPLQAVQADAELTALLQKTMG